MDDHEKRALIRRYRKVSWGRLYWKRNSRFERDDVCIVRRGTLTIHYKSLARLIEEINRAEQYTQSLIDRSDLDYRMECLADAASY